MLEWKSKPYVGFLAPLFVPIIRLYETLKFGAYATLSVSEGALKTSVPILVLHGDQDEVIPMSYGIGSFETILAVDRDVTLRYLPDTGHQITGTGIPVSEFDLFLGL